MTEFDLTGTWEGHYVQGGRQHGISMRVVQRGASFVGAMRDVDTLLVSQERLHAASVEDGKDAEVLGEAEVLSSLPEHSFVEGEVEGRLVTFTKRYQGKSSTSIWVEGKANLTFETPGHAVHYRGVLSPDGDLLSGMWRIPPQHSDGELMRDHFELRRSPTA
ncbi:MAG: hypothetical protein U1F60_13290 [Planctomycetota bacterium]